MNKTKTWELNPDPGQSLQTLNGHCWFQCDPSAPPLPPIAASLGYFWSTVIKTKNKPKPNSVRRGKDIKSCRKCCNFLNQMLQFHKSTHATSWEDSELGEASVKKGYTCLYGLKWAHGKDGGDGRHNQYWHLENPQGQTQYLLSPIPAQMSKWHSDLPHLHSTRTRKKHLRYSFPRI